MSAAATPEQVARIKAKMREDPEIHHLSKILKITVEQFLADIEKQGEQVHLHDATTPAERAQTEAQIVAAAEKGYGDAEQRRQSLQGRKDVRLGADSARREATVLSFAGAKASKAAPTSTGKGAVLACDDETGSRIKAQLSAARTRR